VQRSRDIAIVGGGLVGMSLAALLDAQGWSVLAIEAEPPRDAAVPAWDERNFALNRRTLSVLAEAGVADWPADESRAIETVEVSSRGDPGIVRIRAADYAMDQLGRTVPARVVVAALARRMAALTRVELRQRTRVTAMATDGDRARLTLDGPAGADHVDVRLVVAADGTASTLRGLAGIAATRRDYGQTAVVATIECDGGHDGVAFERFHADGALALLPLAGRRRGLVCTTSTAEGERLMALADDDFLREMRGLFGPRCGAFLRVGRRQSWPLAQVLAERLTAERLVLVGNAAHTVHPLGAQGFNLGLRDVDTLARLLADAQSRDGDPGASGLLDDYARLRAADRAATTRFADDLLHWFQPRSTIVRHLRGLGLVALDRLPMLKREFAFRLMGYRDAAHG
jgi:2-octaprenyl-6-methoxyphenol hydroxylase